ncbi:MAG: ATP-binding cassette domain-containing protein [Pirellulaceae bacterium]
MALIELKDIRRVYDLGEVQVHALRSVTRNVELGEYIALIGGSGSGKSTLMNTLGCLDRPTHGSYLLGGEEVVTSRIATSEPRSAIDSSDSMLSKLQLAQSHFGVGECRTAADVRQRYRFANVVSARWKCSAKLDWPIAIITIPASSPVGNNNAWPSHAPWSIDRPY